MGRTISGTLDAILVNDAAHDIDWTLELVFPATTMRFATSPLVLGGHSYANGLENISAIRQTIEAPTDNVSVGLQNKDRVLGLDIAANWQNWRKATAVLGRNYYGTLANGVRTGTTAWIEMFRGAVQRPNANDFQVTFDVIPDVDAAGQIVADRNLGPICPAVFQDLKTCGFAGLGSTCNHILRSKLGCDGYNNSHRFMGFEHRYDAQVNAPGTGGNDDPPDDDGGGHFCPRVDQYVRIKGKNGEIEPMMVAFLNEDYELWNPKLRRFFPIDKCTLVKGQRIREIVTASGAVGFSSVSHPLIADVDDNRGTAIGRMSVRDRVLAVHDELIQTYAVAIRDDEQLDNVMRIEMRTERPEQKIYCYGDSPEKMIVCHNWKPPLFD